MGRPLLLIVLLATACSASGVDAPEQPSGGDTTVPSTATTAPETVVEEPRPVWPGFQATNTGAPALVALATRPLEVYPSPESDEPSVILDQSTILGTVTVLAALGEPEEGWLEVMLPVRPNGSTGWVRSRDVSLYVADGVIEVDLSERRLTYTVEGVVVLETEVGVGSDFNQTPTGTYFVTDRVTMSDPGGPWGPHALGLSARSDSITEFNGGDGIIGIHGTNNTASIGDNISLGCIRVPNETISVLHGMVPIGTRVTVSA
jgi:lipoprotein-anchoring transpeptidase ErfK/SrfK